MKRILVISVLAGLVAMFLLNASQDVRSIVGWALTGYLVYRAFPAVAGDVRWLWRGLRSRRLFGFRTQKVDTL